MGPAQRILKPEEAERADGKEQAAGYQKQCA